MSGRRKRENFVFLDSSPMEIAKKQEEAASMTALLIQEVRAIRRPGVGEQRKASADWL